MIRTSWRPDRNQLLLCGKIAALVWMFTALAAIWFDRVSWRTQALLEAGSYHASTLYLVIVGLCLVAFALTPFLRSNWLRLALCGVMIAGYGAEMIAIGATGFALDMTLIDILWTNVSMVSEAIDAYRNEIRRAVTWLVPLAAVLLWSPGRFALPSVTAVIPIVAFAATFSVAAYTRGGISQFFSPISVPTAFAAVATNGRYRGPRASVQYQGRPGPRLKNVVLVIDESVRGDYLAITDPAKRTTPFMVANADSFINFGNGVAATNCSVPSRLVLKSGVRRDQIPDRSQRALKQPNIWQLATAAGFKTVFIDGYAKSSRIPLSNNTYMTDSERAAIDELVPVTGMPPYERDPYIAGKLREILSREGKWFALVEKMGSHFPYASMHPPGFAGAEGPASAGDPNDIEHQKRSYRLAVEWSVDGFFSRLLPGLDLSETLIVYTSDHGQNLGEGGYRQQHCSTTGQVHWSEANVPMIAVTGHAEIGATLREAAIRNYDATTHFEVFPTMLRAMGYEKPWILAQYGHDLIDPVGDRDAKFLIGDLFGSLHGWRWAPGRAVTSGSGAPGARGGPGAGNSVHAP